MVATQVRLAQELGAEVIRSVATAAVREASNGEIAAQEIAEASGVEVDILSEEERVGSPSSAPPRRSGIRWPARSASSTSAVARPR